MGLFDLLGSALRGVVGVSREVKELAVEYEERYENKSDEELERIFRNPGGGMVDQMAKRMAIKRIMQNR